MQGIENLHLKCSVISLEQRRRNQLMIMMYKRSRDLLLLRVFPRNTRESTRRVFKTANFEGTMYNRSPYYVGAKLWDSMAATDIDLPEIFAFRKRLKQLSNKYVDLLA